MKLYLPSSVQNIENRLFEKNDVSPEKLMEKAAASFFDEIFPRIKPSDAVSVLCGKGNNAGDGYELARLLKEKGVNVICIDVFGSAPSTEPAKSFFDRYVSSDGALERDLKKQLKIIAVTDVIIDAVFGIGFHGNIEDDSNIYKIIDSSNNARAFKIALDVPSGVRCGDGSVGNIAFAADETLTLAACKVGLVSYPAKLFCGKITLLKLPFLTEALEKEFPDSFSPDGAYVKSSLPARLEFSSKGDYGKLLAVCGSKNMPGAAMLSCKAALRSGVGLLTLASDKSVINRVSASLAEPIYVPYDEDDAVQTKKISKSTAKYTSVLIGCGLGVSENKKEMLYHIITTAYSRLIIDADGINMLADNINILKEAHKTPVITPHPLEFSRISSLDVNYINENRIKVAREFAQKYSCIVVLKGAGTVIASPDGRYAVNASGNPGLAKGGSGDVLAGLMAGLAANTSVDVFDAAVCAVYLHGRAADVLKQKYSEYGFLPSDLPEEFAKMLP
jgi:NAD(P)H-hydrate epimerase